MKKVKVILIVLILILGAMLIVNTNRAYAAETKTLNYQFKRPYSDDNGDRTVGNDEYLLTRTGPTLYKFPKIYDVNNTIVANGNTFTDFIYCLRGGVGFGNNTDTATTANVKYTEIGEMHKNAGNKDAESTIIKTYKDLFGVNLDRTESINEKEVNIYNAILWIADNAYLPLDITKDEKTVYDASEYKTELLNKIGIAQVNHELITDDDLEVVQQLAFWYFTNYDQKGNSSSVSVQATDPFTGSNAIKVGTKTISEINSTRAGYLDRIYKYFITNAIKNGASYGTGNERTIGAVKPTIEADDNVTTKIEKSGNFYVIGPINIKKTDGNIDYKVLAKLMDANGKEIPQKNASNFPIYTITESESSMSLYKNNIQEAIGAGIFYIKIHSNFISEYVLNKVTLNIEVNYDYYNTIATMWTNGSTNQPVVIIEKEKEVGSSNVSITAEIPSKFQLNLSKIEQGTNTKLGGAKFELVEGIWNNETKKFTETGIGTEYGPTTIENNLEIIKNKEITQQGISYYQLTETTTPEGYFELKEPIIIKIISTKGDNGYSITAKLLDESGNETTTLQGFVGVSCEDNVILLTVENEKKEFDLSLRKYITKINDTELTGTSSRVPAIKVADLKNETKTTASYVHPKNMLQLKREDEITYTIRVYNEGNVDGKVTEITDYIPEGLELAENNSINTTYGWEKNADGSIKTDYLKNDTLEAYDTTKTTKGTDEKWQKATDDATGLYYFDVQVVCKIKNDVEYNSVLTNIAEITGDLAEGTDQEDRDSQPNNFPNADKVNSYVGNGEEDGYYPGKQDDDDFERVSIESEIFDLSLRKYITKVETAEGITKSILNISEENNTRDLNEIDVTPLKTGKTTADYKHRKDAVVVETGDIVTYTLKVYNEGEIDGYATEIKDILPEGLEFIEPTTNINTEFIKEGTAGTGKYTYKVEEGVLTIKPISGQEEGTTFKKLVAFDETTLDYGEISFKCRITATPTQGNKVLTNIARITGDIADGVDQEDRDSQPETFETPAELSGYIGINSNKIDLTDNTYFYKGQQDDDDFEKVVLLGKNFDLSLRKYITKINGEKVETDRTPKIDMTTLEEKTTTTAKYEHSKEPLIVKQGDIITYTIRVYNEGERDGKATKITDYIPEGLGLLIGYNINLDNLWKLGEGVEAVKLSSLDVYKVAKNNLKIEDFDETEGLNSLDDVQVVKGDLEITTELLSNDNYIIKAYDTTKTTKGTDEKWQQAEDGKGTTGLYYQDIQVSCIVLAPNTHTQVLRNIAEISKAEDTNGNKILITGDDRDSIPGDVDLNDYTPPVDNSSYQEDDDDYEPVILKYFDLALRKFITGVNDEEITTRTPQLSMNEETRNIKYTHPKEETPVKVVNNDTVTYTIRIFNEGTLDGYASEITDDIPEGLEFLPDNETNKTYKWVMYRQVNDDETAQNVKTIEGKDYVETTDASQAEIIVTDYLSKDNETALGENLLQAFDSSKQLDNNNPHYLDIKVAFKVTEPNTSNRIIINSAQISDDTDRRGKEIDDEDSIPAEWNDEEDDQDKEYIYVEYFDLSLLKWVTKTIVTVDGKTTTTETGFEPNIGKTENINGMEIRKNSEQEPIAAVTVDKKKLKSTTVKFVYSIMVTNEGEIPGFATEITDYIPSGLEFKEEDNKAYGWIKDGEDKITTRVLEGTLLKPGDSKNVEIVFTWKNNADNLGLKTNIAEISEDYNDSNSKDIDSIPDNKLKPYEEEQEDDDDYALVILSLKTGSTPTYIVLFTIVISIIGGGIFLIKKYVLAY